LPHALLRLLETVPRRHNRKKMHSPLLLDLAWGKQFGSDDLCRVRRKLTQHTSQHWQTGVVFSQKKWGSRCTCRGASCLQPAIASAGRALVQQFQFALGLFSSDPYSRVTDPAILLVSMFPGFQRRLAATVRTRRKQVCCSRPNKMQASHRQFPFLLGVKPKKPCPLHLPSEEIRKFPRSPSNRTA
jgi:hypothetical protein